MEKIHIKNFAAIKDAEIELKNLLILIGEQASGKSTIAKLIYFFKSLRDEFFSQIYIFHKRGDFDEQTDLIVPIRQKFYDFFGSPLHLPNFSIRFYFSVEKDKYLNLSLDTNKKLCVEFNSNFLTQDFIERITEIRKEYSTNDIALKSNILRILSQITNNLFECNLTNQLYLIEGRNSTVSYSSSFENYFFADLYNKINEQSKLSEENRLAKLADEKTMNEYLMLRFVQQVSKLKNIFQKYGNFEGLIESYVDNEEEKKRLLLVKENIDKILKGNYRIDDAGEKIVINEQTGEYVYLSNASSGQKESIRILQDIFMVIFENQSVLRIIEEPEAHLFPVAQKQIIELFALMLNANPNNQLIITTHSPYVLTAINNLLFAQRVVEKNSEVIEQVNTVIPQLYHLNPNGFSAYSIGNSLIGDIYCENIFNSKTGLIKQSYLDIVSQMLGGDFNELYEIHAQKFAK